MIIIDAETTSLTAPGAAPIAQQPYIMEFAAINVDDKTLKPVKELQFLCRPPVPIPKESVEITGITDKMLMGEKPFAWHFPTLVNQFLGERFVAAHNLAFDLSALKYELMRMDKLLAFPWPPTHICTVEKTLFLKGYRLNLSQLHELATGKPHEGAHRAMADVQALLRIIQWMRKKDLL